MVTPQLWRHPIDFWATKYTVLSGKRLQFAMERSTMFNGKIHYFYGHVQ